MPLAMVHLPSQDGIQVEHEMDREHQTQLLLASLSLNLQQIGLTDPELTSTGLTSLVQLFELNSKQGYDLSLVSLLQHHLLLQGNVEILQYRFREPTHLFQTLRLNRHLRMIRQKKREIPMDCACAHEVHCQYLP